MYVGQGLLQLYYKLLPQRVFQRMLQAGSYDFHVVPWKFQNNDVYLHAEAGKLFKQHGCLKNYTMFN